MPTLTFGKIKLLPAIVFLILAFLVFLVLYLSNADISQYYTVGWITIVVALVWLGNAGITILLDKWLNWLQYGNIRFFVQLFLGILLTLVIINASYFLLKYLLTQDPPTDGQLIVTNAFGAMIFLPAYCIYFSLNFLNHWRSSELESERYQKESIRSQLESLKNHLDPHFLFNNLNVLSSLIDKDKELSKQFLDNFGEVYRAMLRTRSDDLITLHDELEFINSYFFLIKVRFGENISIDVKVNEKVKNLRLPPLTLQMLVENAFKHNNISEKRPLQISIIDEDKFICVMNSLFEKSGDPQSQTGSGHTTIKERYGYFTKKQVVIEKSESNYTVKVPLLEIEEA